MRRTARRQLTFGDAELRSQVELSGVLKTIADLLDSLPELVERVHSDLVAGLLRPRMGRRGLGPVQVLRAFILQRLENLDLRALAERIADGMSWRVFAGFDAQAVPRHDAFNRAFTRLRPQTVHQINDLVLRKARELGLEHGEKLRVDTTVVETDIRFPTDASLLWDCVRVITREVQQLVLDLPKARRPLPRPHRQRQALLPADQPHDSSGAAAPATAQVQGAHPHHSRGCQLRRTRSRQGTR